MTHLDRHYFIGIKIPSHFASHVEEVRKSFRLREAYKAIPSIEDLHVTLSFLGPVPDSKIFELNERLSAIAEKHTSFSIVVDGVSSFGTKSCPRVIYLSVEENLALNRLQTDISKEVGNVLTKPIDNRFVAHITIAKKWKGLDDFFFEKESRVPMDVPVPAFVLFAIHPNSVPMYETVHTYSLV